jgi:hypothetical protein
MGDAGWRMRLSARDFEPLSIFASPLQLLPQPLKSSACHSRVNDRMAGISVFLHGPQIRAPVGQIEAAGMAQRMWMDVLEACGFCSLADNDGLAGQLRPTLRGPIHPLPFLPNQGHFPLLAPQIVETDLARCGIAAILASRAAMEIGPVRSTE